jgi:phosphomannomutase
MLRKDKSKKLRIVIGRDARPSGEMISSLVSSTLRAMGADVIDLGLSTTPTVEVAVEKENASGGIILTASHNPVQWNALKLLNSKGEFISADEGKQLLKLTEEDAYLFAEVDQLGTIVNKDYLDIHLDEILTLPLVDKESIRKAGFKIAVDAVNSSGGIYVPALLKKLGVEEIVELYCEPHGRFPHNPEPLPEHLSELSSTVVKNNCHIGICVDPDVDRLAFVCEDGSMFGEEYTLVAVADYVLTHNKGNTVSNLSSTRALRDVTISHGQEYFASAVGEVNVVVQMKSSNAVIGGEGNGGIIYPPAHYGRDALVGIALFLTHLAKKNLKASELRDFYPRYVMSKNKIELVEGIDVDEILKRLMEVYSNERINTIDGVKIDFENEWVHLRKSNTEPIIRIYAESSTRESADRLAEKVIHEIQQLV